MGDKILIKADPSMFIEPGTAPSTRQLFNAARGISRDGGSLGAKGRLAGLIGLAGKGAAAYATAEGMADSMQGGNAYAGLGAQYNMQGLDPTQPLTPYIDSGTVQGPPPANHQASMQPHLDAIMGTQPAPAPAPVAVSSPIMSHEEAIAQRRAATPDLDIPYANPLQPVHVQGQPQLQVQQPVQPVQPQVQQPVQSLTQYGMGFEGQPPQVQGQPPQVQGQPPQVQGQPPVDNSHITGMEEYMKNQKNAGEFTDMLYDILGPDNLYKMTPNEIGELAAYMYIKTR